MRKITDYIGVRLYAIKNIDEYRTRLIAKVSIFALSLLAILDIYETVVN